MLSEERIAERKLLHAKASLGGQNRVTILVDTGSTCNATQKYFCVKLSVLVSLSQQQLTKFNKASSKVIRACELSITFRKWHSSLPFHVIDHGTHPILGYSSLKKLGAVVDCVRDFLVGGDDDVVL